MAPTTRSESPEARAERLQSILNPYLFQLLRDAPAFGEVSLSATLHDGTIGRVKLGAEVSRVVPPQAVEEPNPAPRSPLHAEGGRP